MTTIKKEIIVARPVEDVLRFARDWRNIPRYLDYVQSVKPLAESSEGVGAKLHVNLTFLGRSMKSEWETVEYKVEEGWTFKAPLMGVDALKHWRFEPVGESTRVSFVLEYDPKPPIIAPLADVLLLRRKWDQIYERGMQNLKQILESEPPAEAAVASALR